MAVVSLVLMAAMVAPSSSGLLVDSVANPNSPMYRCPVGWVMLEKTCFIISSHSGSWFDGLVFCKEKGATLATISSEFQQALLSNMLTESSWIGLSDLKENNNFVWADGSTSIFTSWASGEPNNHRDFPWIFGRNENCVEMRKRFGFMWNDAHCHHKKQFVCSTPAEFSPECDEGWKMYETSCYQVSNSKATWWKALDICKKQDAHLVSITSKSEQNFLAGMLEENTWIGMYDEHGNNSFTWEDGTELTYTFWSDGEPNKYTAAQEDCVEMEQRQRFQWNDHSCTTENMFICEKPPH